MEEGLTPEERKLVPHRREPVPSADWKSRGIRSRLEAARRARGFSQEQLADVIGIGVATLRRLEAKKTAKTPVQILARCALVLDVPLTALIDAEDCDWPLREEPPDWRQARDMMSFNPPLLPGP